MASELGDRWDDGMTALREGVSDIRNALKSRNCATAIAELALAERAATRLDERGWNFRDLRHRLQATNELAPQRAALAKLTTRVLKRCARRTSTGKAKRSRQKAGLGGLLAGALAGFIGGRLSK